MISGQAFLVNHLAQVYELLVVIIHMSHYASMLRYGLQSPSQCGGSMQVLRLFPPLRCLGLGFNLLLLQWDTNNMCVQTADNFQNNGHSRNGTLKCFSMRMQTSAFTEESANSIKHNF